MIRTALFLIAAAVLGTISSVPVGAEGYCKPGGDSYDKANGCCFALKAVYKSDVPHDGQDGASTTGSRIPRLGGVAGC
jgi:hypothetical protein